MTPSTPATSQPVDAIHHPDMVAHITGNAQPIDGRVAHAAAMQQMLWIFPDIHVHTPYPIQLGRGDWITVVTHATGTFTGDMVLPDGKVIASTGKAFDVEFGPNHEVGRRPAHHLGFSGTPLCKRGRSA
jgi:hypothetical protein